MSLCNNFSISDSKSGINKSKMLGRTLPLAQKKWLEKIKEKWSLFLNKMKIDSKADPILTKPLMEIYSIAMEIYSKDGKSLEKWLNESTTNNIQNGNYGGKEEATISTYKEQFKNTIFFNALLYSFIINSWN